VVEELYFRGYLLPRLARYGWWAPAINTVLFSLYHFFTPWQNLTRILALLPMVYAVWGRRDIRIGLGAHVMLNLASSAGTVALLLR
jgi:membrane protease YdiL (CAAX protease family)